MFPVSHNKSSISRVYEKELGEGRREGGGRVAELGEGRRVGGREEGGREGGRVGGGKEGWGKEGEHQVRAGHGI